MHDPEHQHESLTIWNLFKFFQVFLNDFDVCFLFVSLPYFNVDVNNALSSLSWILDNMVLNSRLSL